MKHLKKFNKINQMNDSIINNKAKLLALVVSNIKEIEDSEEYHIYHSDDKEKIEYYDNLVMMKLNLESK